jgi:hypothetical protein
MISGSHGGEYEDVAIALMMEAVSISETSVNFYKTTQHSIPEDSHLHSQQLFSKKFPTKILYTFIFSLILATYLAHPNLLHFTTPKLQGDLYIKSRSSLLSNTRLVTSSFFRFQYCPEHSVSGHLQFIFFPQRDHV